ncbi:radical SAM/SPASM domain-containing protein [Patescibacteria group bacterium]
MKLITETFKYASGLTKIWDKQMPSQLIFFVTNRCNGRCPYCFYWRELNKKNDQELSLREIKKISQSMGRLLWFFVSGGEPFLRKDLVQICQTFYKNNHPNSIVIPTNGILVDKIVKDMGMIAKTCPKAKVLVQISIDEIGNKHDKIRQVPGNFAKIESLIPQLKLLQKKYSNLAVQANIVFCSENQNRINQIIDRIYDQFKVDNICLSLIRGEPKEIGTKNIDLKKYLSAHHHLRKKERFVQYTSILSHLITKKEDMHVSIFLKSLKEKKAIVPCLATRQSVVLSPTGDLMVCELRAEKYGNLREVDYDFPKLWRSPKVEKIRKRVKGCYCTQECVYTTNVFLNPLAWPRFLKYLLVSRI